MLAELHWLPVAAPTDFKIALTTFNQLNTHKLSYLRDLLQRHRSSPPTVNFSTFMGVSHGGRGSVTSPPEFGVSGTLMQIPPDFAMFQNFEHQIACIQYSNAVKSLSTPLPNRVFTIFQMYIFNVHQIPLQAENSTFFWRGHGHKIPLRNSFSLGRGLCPSPDPFSVGEEHPAPHPDHLAVSFRHL